MLIEILTILSVTIFLIGVIGTYVYKKIHHLPTGECACCHKGSKKLIKEYRRLYSNKD